MKAVLLLLLLVCIGHDHAQEPEQGEGVEIFFGELDYQEIESAGAFEVVVTKMGFLRSALSLTITPLTFDEFRRAGFSVPDERVFDELNTLDPAEYEINGRQDFDNTRRTLTIPPGRQTIDETVTIPIVTDRINEATEGLMLVVRANEDRSNAADIANLNYVDEGVSLLRITDDDVIIFRFEFSTYSFSESNGTLSNAINVVKQQGAISEQTLTLLVDHVPLTAMFGSDYVTSDVRLVFPPEVNSRPVPITIINDLIPEASETFRLRLFQVLESPSLDISGAITEVTITDEDEINIGIEQSVYSVAEGDSVDVCAIILGPEQIAMGLEAFAMLTAVPGTADGRDHIPFMNVVFLTTDMRKICYSFTAILDGVPENIEFVTVELQSIPGFTTEIVNIDSSRQTAQVFISSNECTEGNNDCSENAQCIDTPESFDCTCNDGFEGNGRICRDIDECSEGEDNCHTNANCINTPGSFRCECIAGYEGDGLDCRDIDECNRRLDTCSALADCSNTIGSFMCRCRDGYEGDGTICNGI